VTRLVATSLVFERIGRVEKHRYLSSVISA